jgi:hypothetical protein
MTLIDPGTQQSPRRAVETDDQCFRAKGHDDSLSREWVDDNHDEWQMANDS